MRLSSRLLIFLVLAVFCGAGCTDQPDVKPTADGTTPVKLALNWYPEVEHGGF